MTETSGKKLLELSKSPDQLFLLEKMLVGLLNSISTPYSRIWKAKATPQGALIFQLRASVQNTEEKEYGLFPTPTVGCEEGGEQSERVELTKRGSFLLRKKNPNAKHKTFGAKLSDAMLYLEKQKMFPTPMSSDWKNMDTAKQKSLSSEVKKMPMFGTPKAQDSRAALTDRGKSNLGEQVHGMNNAKKTGGRLNPNFVEFLMGFPTNWTKIEPTELKDSETQSFHKSHTTSDLPLKKLWRTPTAMDGKINNEERYAARILKGKTKRKSKEKVQINLATEVQVEKLRNDPLRVNELLADEMIKRTKLPSQKEFVEYIRSQTNPQELSKLSSIKFSTVEHWFRRGKSFSHPSIKDWNKIKPFFKEIKFDEELTFTESIEWE